MSLRNGSRLLKGGALFHERGRLPRALREALRMKPRDGLLRS
jgi:hypothetical protein